MTEGAAPRLLDDGVEIRPAREGDIEGMLPLLRAYCEFYESAPPDDGLVTMARTLITDPGQGALFVALDGDGPVGFAAMDWKWAMLKGARIGYLQDLFVEPRGRGRGIAEALIAACAEACRERGMPAMQWMTAPDNRRARTVYERVGAGGEAWMEYELEL
ncbi:MAG: GNAT family N-acetyltransferase [Solirubrobacterales bacterium]